MPVEFHDNSIRVKEELEEALIGALYEAAGEIESRTVRNSRQNQRYGDKLATSLWGHVVNEGRMEAIVGSEEEAGYWEEFGTGEHALNGDGRKGWWVYVEDQDSGHGGKTYSQEEAVAVAASMRADGIKAHATNGIEPNRPLFRAFNSGKNVVKRIFEAHMKGSG